jgi:hypothetical protein
MRENDFFSWRQDQEKNLKKFSGKKQEFSPEDQFFHSNNF